MKKFVLSLVFSLVVISAWGQILFQNTDILLTDKQGRLEKFIEANDINYALVAWADINWIHSDEYTLLLRKYHKWHLVKISAGYIPRERKQKVEIKQRELKKEEANRLIDSLQIATAFRYSQKEFDAIPEVCECEFNGEKASTAIYDAEYFNLLRYSGRKIDKLTRYGVNFYLKNCYLCVPQYKIFLGFVHTYKMLTAEMKSTSQPTLKSSKTQKP